MRPPGSGGMRRSNVPLGVTGIIPPRTFGSPTGFGNILFPGTGNQPPFTDPFNFPSTFANRLGITVGGFAPGFSSSGFGFNSFDNFAPGGAFGGFGSGFIPYPVVVGGDNGGYGGGYPQQQPNVTLVMPPQAQPSSPVTINQNFGPGTAPAATAEAIQPESSGVTVYQAPSPAAAAPAHDDPIFLIALKDTTVYPAIGYWVEGDALHYITPQGKHNQVSLGLVDRQISQRLNEGRKIDFHLPPG